MRPVADAVADSATLLCFDEMQIGDITDAMLVGRLFERLFERGVVVVATSNRAPDELYKDGLNRQLFLPFIALIKDRLEVHQLASATDHRLDRLHGAPVYHAPLGPEATAALDARLGRSWRAGPGTPLTLTRAGPRGDAARVPQRRGARLVRAISAAGRSARPTTWRSPRRSTS